MPTNEQIDVIVHLSEQPIVLQKQTTKKRATSVDKQQQHVLHEMNIRNIHYKLLHIYQTIINAISITVDAKEIHKLHSIPGVVLIEPNLEVKAMGNTSNHHKHSFAEEVDPMFSEIKALWAEGIEGQHIKVAVLDTGIDQHHPDIKDAYKGGMNFIDQSDTAYYNRVRDDHDPSETSPDERPADAPEKYPSNGNPYETYHGTHISGIIAGKHTNGVKGVAPKVDLYAYRVLGAYTSGDMSTIIKGIEEAVIQKMDVINLSLSDDSDLESHAMSIAVNNAVLAGSVVVSTAGNTGSVRGSVRAPGTSRLGIAVGNSTLSDEIDGSSSRGPSRPKFDIKPDIVAPGTEALSTMPRYENHPEAYKDAYKIETGTSQSAPYITGIAALIKQAHPDFTPFDIKIALTNTAKVLHTQSYNVFDQGSGRVQPYAAVHPSILAYTVENIDKNGEGEIVENKKGAVTFGAVSLHEAVSITKPIIVTDIKGHGGMYDVAVHVTQPFEGATVTVDQPSFTLNGECVLHVTLTADEHQHPKYRDEMLGYIHITSQDTSVEVSLPFAADFSDGATVTPAIEEFTIPKKDISSDLEENDIDVTLSITSDLSYPSLEVTDYVSKVPMDSLFYDNGVSLGTRKFPVLHTYTSSWTNETTVFEDGMYSIDFSGMAADEQLTSSIGPIFIKSTKPIITGSMHGSHVEGHVTDQYIDFKQALTELDEGFDINEKLHASYTITHDGKIDTPVLFLLNQDGTYSIELDTGVAQKDSMTITITDAAGNTGSTCFALN